MSNPGTEYSDKDFIDIEALYAQIDALPDIAQIKVSTRLIELCRDVLMVDLAVFRRQGARSARNRGMSPKQIADQSDSSPQTINRLLAESGTTHGGGG